jgi:hypothetical protein
MTTNRSRQIAQQPACRPPIVDEIRVRKLAIVDEQGNDRIRLEMAPYTNHPAPHILLCDSRGRPLSYWGLQSIDGEPEYPSFGLNSPDDYYGGLELEVHPGEAPRVQVGGELYAKLEPAGLDLQAGRKLLLRDVKGKRRLELDPGQDGKDESQDPSLQVFDHAGTLRAELGLYEVAGHETPCLALWDSGGKERQTLGLDSETDEPYLNLRGDKGPIAAALRLEKGRLQLKGPKGAALVLDDLRTRGVTLLDEQGRPRGEWQATKDHVYLTMADARGEERVRLEAWPADTLLAVSGGEGHASIEMSSPTKGDAVLTVYSEHGERCADLAALGRNQRSSAAPDPSALLEAVRRDLGERPLAKLRTERLEVLGPEGRLRAHLACEDGRTGGVALWLEDRNGEGRVMLRTDDHDAAVAVSAGERDGSAGAIEMSAEVNREPTLRVFDREGNPAGDLAGDLLARAGGANGRGPNGPATATAAASGGDAPIVAVLQAQLELLAQALRSRDALLAELVQDLRERRQQASAPNGRERPASIPAKRQPTAEASHGTVADLANEKPARRRTRKTAGRTAQ